MTRDDVRTGAKYWAQIAQAGGARIVITDGDEAYNAAIAQAQIQYSLDRPNNRVAHVTIATAGYVQPLTGTGALIPDWTGRSSALTAVWLPWTGGQDSAPLDEDSYQLLTQPDGTIGIWFRFDTPAVGTVIRLEYRTPRVVDESDPASTTVPDEDLSPFSVLTAFYVLTQASILAVRNTGNTGLPTDIVDRRTQSDIFRARAKDLWSIYASSMGIGSIVDSSSGGKGTDTGSPLGGFRDLDIPASTAIGFLWRRR